MASTKGIVLTIFILAGITGASFLLWLIPQNYESTFVISDYKSFLESKKDIHQTLSSAVDDEFQKLLTKDNTPDEYITTAEISSSQINSQIMQLIESDPPEEWYESYLNYIESLKKFNLQIKETIVLAKMINDVDEKRFQKKIDEINSLKMESDSFSQVSDEARP